jgi:hypothetical protein
MTQAFFGKPLNRPIDAYCQMSFVQSMSQKGREPKDCLPQMHVAGHTHYADQTKDEEACVASDEGPNRCPASI